MFPKISKVESPNVISTEFFSVMKRKPLESYNYRVFNYNDDRMIPSRQHLNTEFLRRPKNDKNDISSAENNLTLMKKTQYQNTLRKQFQQDFQITQDRKRKRNNADKVPLIHFDWTCKIESLREKFYPDFETVKKPGFGKIRYYTWSKKHIIAAVSRSKISLYHPFNGFTRALDVQSAVCVAFSNDGNKLAMAYRKSDRESPLLPDIYIFKFDEKIIFDNCDLDTLKLNSRIPQDVTAVCFSPDNKTLLCGTEEAGILLLQFQNELMVKEGATNHFKTEVLTNEFQHWEIIKIAFSCEMNYFAALDLDGMLVIWEWETKTPIYNFSRNSDHFIRLFEWHPFVNEELIVGNVLRCGLFLINVKEKRVTASYQSSDSRMQLRSMSFNPINGQLAVNFWIPFEDINRVCILASMSEVLNKFDFDYFPSALHVFWNPTGSMLAVGARCFRFAFWSYDPSGDFKVQVIKDSACKNPTLITTLNDTKLSSLR